MPSLFGYVCEGCNAEFESETSVPIGVAHPVARCPGCGGALRRMASMPAFKRGMETHFNHTVGTVVSNMGQFKSELHKASDEVSERTGMEHKFEPVDTGDPAAHGVTDEGLDSTRKMRRKMGLDDPTKKIIV